MSDDAYVCPECGFSTADIEEMPTEPETVQGTEIEVFVCPEDGNRLVLAAMQDFEFPKPDTEMKTAEGDTK